MYDKIDELVDYNLPMFLEYSTNELHRSLFKLPNGDKMESRFQARLGIYMKEKGLVDCDYNEMTFSLTQFGYDVSKEGWLSYLELEEKRVKAHLELQEAERKFQRVKTRIELDNLEWNTRLTKWQVKSKYLPYVFSFLGLVISVFALWLSISANTTSKSVESNIISEKELTTGSSSTSNRTKKVDSLRNSKSESDNLPNP